MDAAFAEAVRDLVMNLAAGGEPSLPGGGGLARVVRETGAPTTRAALETLADRWFRAVPPQVRLDVGEPLLNRSDLGDSEKLHVTLTEHVVGQRRWQELSSNESTFYRYRRAAIAALTERLWSDVAERRLPSNRPQPEYVRFIGREAEVATLLRWLNEPGGTVAGVEGPGGSGKTALLHAVADVCESAARSWLPTALADGVEVPLFDALVWVACSDGSGLATLFEAVARTLDYPGLLARTIEDSRQTVRDLLARRAILLLVDDIDRGDPSLLGFLTDLPAGSRALVAGRRRLPTEIRALMPEPLTADAVRELLLSEAERQGAPEMARALHEDTGSPLAAAARYPLLAGWAVGQLRRGQTVERVRERLGRAEGEVFGEMFDASIAGLSPPARDLLEVLPLLAAPTDRATLARGRRRVGRGGARRAVGNVAARSERGADRRGAALRAARGHAQLRERESATGAERRTSRAWRAWSSTTRRWPRHGAARRPTGARSVDSNARCRTSWPWSRRRARRRAIETASHRGPCSTRPSCDLAHALRNVFSFGGAWSEGLVLFHRAIEAARRLGDARAEGWNLYRLGVLHYELGTGGYAEAALRAREAHERLALAGDSRGRGPRAAAAGPGHAGARAALRMRSACSWRPKGCCRRTATATTWRSCAPVARTCCACRGGLSRRRRCTRTCWRWVCATR